MQFRSFVSTIATLLLICVFPAHAACVRPATLQSIEDFVRAPKFLLDRYPRGEEGLSWSIGSLATTSTDALNAITGLVKIANLDQRKAIGRGLAVASRACRSRDPALIQELNSAIRKIDDPDTVRAYHTFVALQEPHSVTPAPSNQNDTPLRGSVIETRPMDRKTLPLGDPFQRFDLKNLPLGNVHSRLTQE